MSAVWISGARWLRPIWEAGLDLIYPRQCLGCASGMADADYRHLCARCRAGLETIHPPCCPLCGLAHVGAVDGSQPCRKCDALKPEFNRGRALWMHRGLGAALVHELKYHQGLWLAGDIARLAGQTPGIREHLAGAVLVPVPLHPRKLRERGFNQGEVIARALLPLSAGGRVQPLLRRVRDTDTQTQLGSAARAANVKNAFAFAPAPTFDPAIPHILVDDVYTTGSTLNACARELRRHGVRDLGIQVLAHG